MLTKSLKLYLLLFMLLTSGAANSLTVDCPDLSEAVVKARFIFDGTVIDKQARQADTPNGKERMGRIYTYYTFAIQRVFKGSVTGDGKTITLRMAGGSLSGNPEEAETIPGLPHYEIDDRAILFMTNNGRSMSPLVCWMFQYSIPRADRLVHDQEIVKEAWFTPNGHLVYKPKEETLRWITKNTNRNYEAIKSEITETYEHFFHSVTSDGYQGLLQGGTLHPDGTWTPPEGAIPYDQNGYAELLGTFVERAIEEQALQGRLQKTAPLPNLDIKRPHYEGTFGEALDEHGKPLPPDNNP
jgi:hypothetical protein